MKKINFYLVDINDNHFYLHSTNNYKTCKSALNGFSKILENEFKANNIDVFKGNRVVFSKPIVLNTLTSKKNIKKIYASFK